ncbi:MAG: UDP-N-acetylmuramoyl-L-alanyl-D-glutamate--2,6-diaminopimelate ligase [Bacteroidota bacterium]|jgi:UDP-N-acetylmuramoyl-L-alanyl-D-glutamate--2,6-diaminopimelate ligase
MKLSNLISDLKTIQITNFIDKDISSLQYDSRKTKAQSVFVALRGTLTDGHKYIHDVIAKGCSVIVLDDEKYIDREIKSVIYILVENSRTALAKLSHNWYENPSEGMKIIGITGTNGKTTITYLLKSIFESAGIKTGIIGTTGIFYGNEIITATHTTPESLELCKYLAKMKDAGVQTVLMEVSSHALSQHRVDCIQFSAAIFTNLTLDHLDYHSSMKDYAKAKKRLFDMLSKDGIALVTDNSEYSALMLKDTKCKTKLYIGRKNTSDIIIAHEELNLNFSSFELHSKLFRTPIKINTPLPGRFNIDNVSFSASLCLLLGIDKKNIKLALGSAPGAPGRMQKVTLKNEAVAIVDYAHTPDALEKVLLTCREILQQSVPKSGKLFCVFGCGGDRDKSKRPLMGKIAATIADFVIITDDNPRTEDAEKIIEQIYHGVFKKDKQKTVIISKREEAIKYAVNNSKEGDIILVAGKGHETYQIIGTQKIHFDDVEELKKF